MIPSTITEVKVRHFLRDHEDHISIHKLKRNDPLTKQDLKDISRIKKVAEGLYETLQTEISKVQVFYAKQSTRDDVKVRIKNYLWDDQTGLPESFNPDEIEEKTDAVFAHVLMSVRNGSAFQEAR